MENYRFLIHYRAFKEAKNYFTTLDNKKPSVGYYFGQLLKSEKPIFLETEKLLELLVNTKIPQIFSESQIMGDGSDWNNFELSILGNILAAVPVRVFDDGLHEKPLVFKNPFEATLIYVPGALLRNDKGRPPADWENTTREGKIHAPGYYHLYEQRLLPALLYASRQAVEKGNKALVTIPGIGCGQFAGQFKGRLGELLGYVIGNLLVRYHTYLPGIRAVYYDPYQEGKNGRYEIGRLSYLVRPFRTADVPKSQLNPPQAYAEDETDDFSNCELFSLVAWDHVSWPGNDFLQRFAGY